MHRPQMRAAPWAIRELVFITNSEKTPYWELSRRSKYNGYGCSTHTSTRRYAHKCNIILWVVWISVWILNGNQFTLFLILVSLALVILRSTVMLIIGLSSASSRHHYQLFSPAAILNSLICPTFPPQHLDKSWDRPQAPLNIEHSRSSTRAMSSLGNHWTDFCLMCNVIIFFL